MSDNWVAELYDDREPEKVIEHVSCHNEDQAHWEARRLLQQWEDPDDGVRPLHLQSRVKYVGKHITPAELYEKRGWI